MPRLRDTLVNRERFGETTISIVRLPKDEELPFAAEAPPGVIY